MMAGGNGDSDNLPDDNGTSDDASTTVAEVIVVDGGDTGNEGCVAVVYEDNSVDIAYDDGSEASYDSTADMPGADAKEN